MSVKTATTTAIASVRSIKDIPAWLVRNALHLIVWASVAASAGSSITVAQLVNEFAHVNGIPAGVLTAGATLFASARHWAKHIAVQPTTPTTSTQNAS